MIKIQEDYIEDIYPWNNIVTKLLQDLEDLNQDIFVDCIKEKFGTLRVYVTPESDEARALISLAEDLCDISCQDCETTVGVELKGKWVRNLCGKCREIYE